MTAAALDQLIAAEEIFISALDGEDIGAIEQAALTMRATLASVAASGAWNTNGETGARLVQAMRLAEAAGGRVNYLADRNRRRLDKLAQLSGAQRPQAYSRYGRFG